MQLRIQVDFVFVKFVSIKQPLQLQFKGGGLKIERTKLENEI